MDFEDMNVNATHVKNMYITHQEVCNALKVSPRNITDLDSRPHGYTLNTYIQFIS